MSKADEPLVIDSSDDERNIQPPRTRASTAKASRVVHDLEDDSDVEAVPAPNGAPVKRSGAASDVPRANGMKNTPARLAPLFQRTKPSSAAAAQRLDDSLQPVAAPDKVAQLHHMCLRPC